MKASLFAEAEDGEDSDMFQEHVARKSSVDVSSPRHPVVQGRSSGKMSSQPSLMLDFFQVCLNLPRFTLSYLQSVASFRLVSRPDSSSHTCQILPARHLLRLFLLHERLLGWLNPHDYLSGRGQGPHPSCFPPDLQKCPSGQLVHVDWAGLFRSKSRSLRGRLVHLLLSTGQEMFLLIFSLSVFGVGLMCIS